MANKERKFKVGDVVRLNSGGPDMTVTSLVNGQVFLNCTYFDGELKEVKRIDENTLTIVRYAK